jgi:hypothetical protein
MPIPPGSWDITAGGVVGVLTFAANTGAVSGTIFGDPFVGFFDETSQTLKVLGNPQVQSEGGFTGVLVTPFTVYQGSLFPPFTPPGGGPISILSGVFSSNTGDGAATYSTWFAQNPSPVKVGKEGKDGKERKDHKDKEKEKDKDHADKVPKDHEVQIQQFRMNEPFSSEPPLMARSMETGSATGQSFIQASERPPVGEAALQDVRVGRQTER